MNVSKFIQYSLGIVAINKPLSSDIIEVTPVEYLTMLDGEINDHVTEVDLKSKNYDGSEYETKTKQTITLKARWMPMGSNRITSPDVRRGEQVMIWRYGDSDRFYWSSLEYQKRLRKLETIIFGISATKDEDDNGNPDSMYYLEISSHRKIIHFHTSKKNDEPYAYDLQLNTADGYLLFQDDVGNLINLNSKDTYIEITNADKSTIQLDKRNILADAPDFVDIVAGKQVTIETPMTRVTQNMGVNGKASVDGTLSANGMKSTKPVTSPDFNLGFAFDRAQEVK